MRLFIACNILQEHYEAKRVFYKNPQEHYEALVCLQVRFEVSSVHYHPTCSHSNNTTFQRYGRWESAVAKAMLNSTGLWPCKSMTTPHPIGHACILTSRGDSDQRNEVSTDAQAHRQKRLTEAEVASGMKSPKFKTPKRYIDTSRSNSTFEIVGSIQLH